MIVNSAPLPLCSQTSLPSMSTTGEAVLVYVPGATIISSPSLAAFIAAFGVPVVNGFTGSSIWGKFYFFPPTPESVIDAGFEDFRNCFDN